MERGRGEGERFKGPAGGLFFVWCFFVGLRGPLWKVIVGRSDLVGSIPVLNGGEGLSGRYQARSADACLLGGLGYVEGELR